MSLQSEWQYLQSTFPGVGTLMGYIEEALREKSPPSLFGGEEITANFRKILGHSFKHGGLGIPDPRLSAESAYNTSKAASIFKRQEQAGGQEKKRLHRETRNGAWLSAVPHCLNGTELSQE